MSLNLTNIFTLVGQCMGAINLVNTERTNITSKYSTMFSDYEPVTPSTFDGYLATFNGFTSSQAGFLNQLAKLAQNTVINLVNAYQAQPNSSLTQAMNVLISQMESQGQTVNQYSVGNSIAYGATNSGNSVVVVSSVDNLGQPLEQQYAEIITGTCIRDSNTGGASVGSEGWSVIGQASDSAGLLDFQWPQGSGSSLSLTAVNSLTSTNGNLLAGTGDFETWSSGSPVSWTLSSTSKIVQSTTSYKGTYSIELEGDGSTNLYAYYNFPTNLSPSTLYQWNLWIKLSSVPAAGAFLVCLQNQSGTILDNVSGGQNAASYNLTTLSSGSWINLNGSFQTPALVPANGYRLYIGTTTAISSGKNLFVDSVSFFTPSRFGTVGPYISIFSGNTTAISGDTTTITTTNSGSVTTDFQMAFFRLGLTQAGTLLPYSGSPTISNSLIS